MASSSRRIRSWVRTKWEAILVILLIIVLVPQFYSGKVSLILALSCLLIFEYIRRISKKLDLLKRTRKPWKSDEIQTQA